MLILMIVHYLFVLILDIASSIQHKLHDFLQASENRIVPRKERALLQYEYGGNEK